MNTLEKIKADALEARKARDTIKANVLTTLIAELCRNTKEPSEEEVAKGVAKFLKNLEKSIEIQRTAKLEQERQIIEAYGMARLVSGDYMISVNELLANNPDKILNEKTIGWYVGQTMKATKGAANPATVKSYLEDKMHKANFLDEETKSSLDFSRVSANIGKY